MKVIRWIFAFPLALAAILIVFYLARIIMLLIGENPDAILQRLWIGFLCGGAYMFMGLAVVPSHKKQFGIALIVLGILMVVASSIVDFSVANVTALIGMLVTYFYQSKNGFELDD